MRNSPEKGDGGWSLFSGCIRYPRIHLTCESKAARLPSGERPSCVRTLARLAHWKVRSEPFGSRLCQDGSSERWVQRWVQLGPVLGSFFGVKRCRINELIQI
jgi:hypothetical protein